MDFAEGELKVDMFYILLHLIDSMLNVQLDTKQVLAGRLLSLISAEREGAVLGVIVGHGRSHCNQMGTLLRILCREGWLRGSSQIILGFLVVYVLSVCS